ncbi:MAG: hypothetical protein PHF86_02130 [Candidatus Nanoarchaeia archaeon]|nr:hypothetical protein [Candidatus Nanoarchaeia archaeon]
MKFNYAPGMPGYGTRGIDGSTGLTGLSTYFSQYDGDTETSFIKSKIQNNKILFSVDQALPDGRIYWTGDIFIDRNGKVFEIDLSLSNLYKSTSIALNVSGYFEVLKNSPYYSFQRLSNRYSTNPILIDVVYTDPGTGDYTTYPTSIYSNSPADFAQVKYDDKAIAGYYPFEVWTIGSAVDDDAIALVKESINNYWHLGNKDGATVKNATLYLDFKQTFIESSSTNIAGNVNISGGIQVTSPAYFSDDFYIGGELRVENGTWLRQNVAIGGKLAVDSDISTYGSAYISGTTFIGSDVTALGNLSIGGKLSANSDISTYGSAYISGDAFIGGGLTFLGNLALGGKLAVNSDVSIGGNTKIAGTLEVDSVSSLLGYVGVGKPPSYPLEVSPNLTTNFTSSAFSGSQVVGRIGDGTATIDDNYLPPYAMIGGSFISSYISQNFDNIGVFGFAEGTGNSEVTAGGLFSANQTGGSKAVGVYIRAVTGSTTYGIYQLGGASNYFASPITIESATAGLPLIADANKVITTENAADFRTRIGLGSIATNDEVLAGTDNTVLVTPYNLLARSPEGTDGNPGLVYTASMLDIYEGNIDTYGPVVRAYEYYSLSNQLYYPNYTSYSSFYGRIIPANLSFYYQINSRNQRLTQFYLTLDISTSSSGGIGNYIQFNYNPQLSGSGSSYSTDRWSWMTTYVSTMAVNYLTSTFIPIYIQIGNVSPTQNSFQIRRQDYGNFANGQKLYINVAGVLPLLNVY